MKKPPPTPPKKSLPQPLRKEGSPYWMKKPPQAPPKGGDVLFAEDLQYYLCLSSSELVGAPLLSEGLGEALNERMGLSPFRGSWRGLEVGGSLPFVTPLHVTRYIFAYGVFVGRQGGYSFIIIYNIYIIYNNNFIYILIYNLFTLKIYILLLFVLLCFFCP